MMYDRELAETMVVSQSAGGGGVYTDGEGEGEETYLKTRTQWEMWEQAEGEFNNCKNLESLQSLFKE